jgi:hypothetical protein
MPRYRINWITGGFILALTLIVDGLQILLTVTLIGSIVSMVMGALMGFILWLIFVLHHVKYSGTGGFKKAGTLALSVLVEFIPFADMLPAITTGALLTILETRKEDRAAFAQAQQQERARKQALAAQYAAMMQAANDNQALAAIQEAA